VIDGIQEKKISTGIENQYKEIGVFFNFHTENIPEIQCTTDNVNNYQQNLGLEKIKKLSILKSSVDEFFTELENLVLY